LAPLRILDEVYRHSASSCRGLKQETSLHDSWDMCTLCAEPIAGYHER
jgi:hypothetical protein